MVFALTVLACLVGSPDDNKVCEKFSPNVHFETAALCEQVVAMHPVIEVGGQKWVVISHECTKLQDA